MFCDILVDLIYSFCNAKQVDELSAIMVFSCSNSACSFSVFCEQSVVILLWLFSTSNDTCKNKNHRYLK
jgi:hypothetical protein